VSHALRGHTYHLADLDRDDPDTEEEEADDNVEEELFESCFEDDE
jgi:hypothetical protein